METKLTDVAVVVDCRSDIFRLEQTLASVARQQQLRITSEILVLCYPENISAVNAAISNNPWLLGVTVIQMNPQSQFKDSLWLLNTHYFVVLRSGDLLLSHSLSYFLTAARKNPGSVIVAPARYYSGRQYWSEPGIESVLSSASDGSSSIACEYLLNEKALLALQPTAPLLKDGKPACRYVALSEYVVDRYCSSDGSLSRRSSVGRSSRVENETLPARGLFPPKGRGPTKRSCGPWLIGERRGLGAEDNGIAFFRYLITNVPELECYYVLDNSARLELPEEVAEKTLVKGTASWEDALARSHVLCFTDSAVDILQSMGDVSNYLDRHFVFLTHGVLAYSAGVYPKDHPYIDHVICTSHSDGYAGSQTWGFPLSRFLYTGLPRWDSLVKCESNSSRDILLCPTWRKSLESDFWEGAEGPSQIALAEFEASDFYRGWVRLLQSDCLINLLERENLRIRVRLHFRFNRYLTAFESLASERIVVDPIDSQEKLSEVMQSCIALITDYSSIMWDMAYMEKPVICYQFDKPGMLAERGRSAFSLRDDELVAEVCYSTRQVERKLEDLAFRGFVLDEKALSKLEQFIPHRTGSNCQRVYEALLQRLERQCALSGSHSRRLTEEQLPLRSVEEALMQRRSSGRTFLLSPHDFVGSKTVPATTLASWGELMGAVGKNDFVLLEPYLDASSEWGECFFDWGETLSLIDKIIEIKAEKGGEIGIALPVAYCFRREITNLLEQFDVVVDALDRYQNAPAEKMRFDVSVVVPVFNGERHLARCIDSVVQQQFDGTCELIVVDDGSTDRTIEVVESYSSEALNITLICQSNSRQGVARNRGIVAALGDFITFVDADDVLPPHAIAELWCQATGEGRDLSIGLVASTRDALFPQRINQSYFHYTKSPDIVSAQIWPHVFYDPSCVGKLYRKSYLVDQRLFFAQSFHEDQLFCMQLFASGVHARRINEILYFYLIRQEENVQSGTQTFSLEKLKQMMRVGCAIVHVLKRQALPKAVLDHAVGFLLIRYDRYFWKREQLGFDSVSLLDDAPATAAVMKFLSVVEDEIIVRHSKHNAVSFLLLKRGQYELYRQWVKKERDVSSYLLDSKILKEEDLERVNSGELWQNEYDYYRSVEVGTSRSGIGWEETLVTDMSYGYRLGALFVDSVKQPKQLLVLPWRTIALLFDMISRRGRAREERRRAALEKTSPQALEVHSDYIKKTAAYRLGVLLMEAVVMGRPRIHKLPGKIKRIYRETV